jgi:hypothetical protein
VRSGFRQLADTDPDRYLVLDATRPPGELSRQIQERVRELLPDPVPPSAEAITGSFPAITDVSAPDGAGPATGPQPGQTDGAGPQPGQTDSTQPGWPSARST